MKKLFLLLAFPIFLFPIKNNASATETDSTIVDSLYLDSLMLQLTIDSINNSFTYQTGKVTLKDVAVLNVPKGYKFMDAKQSLYVLTQLWGNPPDSATLGLLFPENMTPFAESPWAIEITYSDEGHIDDDDADDIDYDELLEEMKKDVEEANEARVKEGYPKVHLIGWAAKPFYDKEHKKLHWAKELKFDSTEGNVLNYNIRALGRGGVLVLNAIGNMKQFPEINKDIDKVIASVEFTEGQKYSAFNPDIDKVAAYGIGALVAGKVLAKVGFFALLLKFWKVIALGAVALFAALRKKIFGSKDNTEGTAQ